MSTATDIAWLRRILYDPAGPSTFFTDEELTAMLVEANNNKYKVASEGWMMKAAAITANNIVSYTIGPETYTYVSPAQAYDHCMKLSAKYAAWASGSLGKLFEGTANSTKENSSYSALMGGKYDA
jgi:hypothetical protein